MKNINKEIENFLTTEHKEELTTLLNNLKEYRNIRPEHDFKYLVSYIRELILNGSEKNFTSILSGSDESDFNILDNLSRLEEEPDEKTTQDLIDFIKHYNDDEIYKLFQDDYIENDYFIEDLLYIFNLKNLYDSNIFSYNSSYSGNLYFNSVYVEKLDLKYIKTIEDLQEFLYDYNIKKLFSVFVYNNYIDNFIMSIDLKTMREQEERTLNAIQKELKKRLLNFNTNIQELQKELNLNTMPNLKEIGLKELNTQKQTLKEVEEVLK